MENSSKMDNREWNLTPRVYVGNLEESSTEEQLEDIFTRYGKVRFPF